MSQIRKIFCIFIILSTSSYASLILKKNKSIHLGYNFDSASRVEVIDEVLKNREVLINEFIIDTPRESGKYLFYDIGAFKKEGRFTFEVSFKPKNKKESFVKYYLVKSKKNEVQQTKRSFWDKKNLARHLYKNDYRYINIVSYTDLCNSGLVEKIIRCFRVFMNQSENINFDKFNKANIPIDVLSEDVNSSWGVVIELEHDLRSYDYKNASLSESRGQSAVVLSSFYPNIVDQTPVRTTSGVPVVEGVVGLKSIGNSRYTFDIHLEESENNFFEYDLSLYSDTNAEVLKGALDISGFHFTVKLTCNDQIFVLKDHKISKNQISNALDVIVKDKLSLDKCGSHKAKLSLETNFPNNQGILFIGEPRISNLVKEKKRPNILMITADALRFDRTSLSGYKRDTTPFLKALSKNGVTFSKYFTQRGFTQTSMPIILSGSYPHSFSREVAFADGYDPRNRYSLPYQLYENNYNVYSVIGSRDYGRITEANTYFPRSVFPSGVRDTQRFKYAYNFLKEQSDRPYFMWLHLNRPHMPYAPIERFRKFSKGMKLQSVAEENKVAYLDEYNRKLPKDLIKNISALYDDNILTMDQLLASFLLTLEKIKKLDNTIIIFSSDHGENFGEHDQMFQHGTVSNATLNVPLVLVYPEKVPMGKKVDSIVESVDLTPTILDLIDLTPTKDLHGKSLLPHLIDPKVPHKKYAYADLSGEFFSIQDKKYKLIYNPRNYVAHGVNFFFPYKHEKYSLYDLDDDPLEANNIFDKKPTIAYTLLEKLLIYSSKFKHVDSADEELSPEILRLLERTGYLHWKKKDKKPEVKAKNEKGK